MNNIFNQLLKSGQNKMASMISSNLGFNTNNNNNNSKQQKLRAILHTCTYSDDKKFTIEKAVKQVFHVYPHFDVQPLSFKQSNQQRRFIQLSAILQIQVRGKICKVDFHMMIPAQFPQKSPYVRIVNRNAQFIVDDFYRPLQSPSDPKSYILNERLNEIKNWDQSKSIVNVIIECYDLMRNKFPFSKSGNKSIFPNNQNSPWQQNYNNNQGGFQPNNTGYNNNMYGNNQNSNFMNYMQGGGFGNQNANYNVGQGQMNQNYGFNQNNNKPPIPFTSNNINQIIMNGQKFSGQSKTIFDKLKVQHTKSLQSVQALDILRYSIQSQENFLRKQNAEMNNFLSNNQNYQPSQSLTNLVKPQDQLSQQILDLLSSIKARQDCTTQLESKFNQGAITLDDFMKNLRRMEQTKFEQKVLLAKCINVSQKY